MLKTITPVTPSLPGSWHAQTCGPLRTFMPIEAAAAISEILGPQIKARPPMVINIFTYPGRIATLHSSTSSQEFFEDEDSIKSPSRLKTEIVPSGRTSKRPKVTPALSRALRTFVWSIDEEARVCGAC